MRRIGLAGVLVVTMAASVCRAETPQWSSGQAATSPVLPRGRMFAGENWWARYGEPINAVALAEQPAGEAGPVPLHGAGYVYAPGACDCPPPCIFHLWAGYEQHPKRCDPYVPLFHRRCGDCCDDACGGACGKGCGAAAGGCAAGVSCTAAADCGCKPACGSCKHFHLRDKWKHFAAHWHRCDSCAAPLDCGCAVPAAPVIPSEKQTAATPPLPLPEEAVLIQLPRLSS